ncbi:MAG: HAMP domain-containing sensor histidine kinase, partial [bacterium]|nr:HAMP domain-containing sensor histidine kinase [bacterium]
AQEMTISIENSFLREKVLRQESRLRELSQLKGDFLSNTSHELTTPLHAIIGLSQGIAEGGDGPVTEEQKGHLKMIEEAGRRLLGIVETVLNLSSLEGKSRDTFCVKKINLKKMIQRMATAVASEIVPLKRSIGYRLDEKTEWIYGDESRIEDLMTKILDNAVQHGGRGNIEVRTEKVGEMVQVAIQDSGRGVPPEERRRIFEEFNQVGGVMARGPGGAGLGLAIARKIVTLHGGRIWLEPAPEGGSIFFFTLPMKPSLINCKLI